MRARSVGSIAVLLGIAGCNGPHYALNGTWALSSATYSTELTLSQNGPSVIGYNVGTHSASDTTVASVIVSGHVTGNHVQLYLPPDSTATFTGVFSNSSTVEGRVTSGGVSVSASLEGPSAKYTPYNPALLDGASSASC